MDYASSILGFLPGGRRSTGISQLLDKLEAYLSPAQVERVREAYDFGAEKHQGQKRVSGEPYITHPVAVADILADLRLDADTLVAAILHDVIEDTPTAKAEIATTFGQVVAELVDGVSKLDQIQFKNRQEAQAESFRKMLLAMVRDIRVIMVKLADRMHNMRTLGVMPPVKRRRSARETLEIYVNALNATPRVALIPLVILWFGLGPVAKIAVVWLLAVLPILINTYAGVQNTDPDLLEAARSFGARRGQLFRYIMLPAAMPYVVSGLRLGAAMAMVGTVFAELYTALSGLGYLMAQYSGSFQTAKYFVPVLVLAGFGMLISELLKILERRMARWKQSREASSV